jgi:predicted phage baseplate assembly protein
MPLEAPQLDTRTFEDLVAEARRRIPRYAPQWTDFNESDPGITLVQLFAWLTEMMLYQLNQVPERNYIKFLQLLGLELRPAQPAEVHLTFTAQAGAPVVDPIPPRTQVGAQSATGGVPLIFETEKGLDVIRAPLTDVQVYDGSAFTVVTPANEKPGTGLYPLGFVPKVNSALYLGFSQSDPPAAGRIFPQEIRMRVFLPAAATAGVPQSSREVNQPPPPPVDLIWEYRPTVIATHWIPLNVYADESAAFTREGYIILEGPADIPMTTEGKIGDPRFWLRARLNAGAYSTGRAPQVDFIRPNTVRAQNLSTVREEIVGSSEGVPDQSFTLNRTPVAPGSLTLTLEVDGEAPEKWVLVEDFLGSGKDDPHYTLNANTGEIRFGNGKNGRIPVAGLTIVASEYRFGGGAAGNVAAGQVTTLQTPVVGIDKVTNERPAVGGRDEQQVDELKAQAPHELRSRNRAVTVEDYIALAGQAGGVAKATAIPLAHPDHPGVEVPGAVTVVVVPDNEDMPPQPSSDLIRQVCAYLDGFRLLTTELFVKGPEYQAITVEAVIAAQPYAAFDAVERDVIAALDDYLDPLGEPGWEFDQDLYPTSLFKVILDIKDVAAVQRIAVSVNGQPHDDLTQPIAVPDDGMVYGKGHAVTVVPLRDR